MHTVADPHKQPAVRPTRRTRNGFIVFLLVIAGLLSLIVYPPTFLFGVRQALGFEAWRYGLHLSIGSMKGSVTDPVWLYHARLTHLSDTGASTNLDIDSARTTFAWQHLFWQRNARVWSDLTLDGVRGIIDLHMASQAGNAGASSPFDLHSPVKPPRLLLPSSLAITHATVAIRQSDGFVLFEDIDLQASDTEAGHLVIGALSVHEPWMTGLFSNCRGALLLQDSQLVLANMKLADSLQITSASADLPELLRGQLQIKFALDAFSGNIQGELNNGAPEQHLEFESSGTFSNISVAQLAAFFGQDADGSITEGKFSFHGSPHDLAKATFTTYFRAGNFRWGARRWNSLVAGVTYVDHRLLIPDFELQQAHNTLTLKEGTMNVPGNWKEWWKTDFSVQFAAKIDNLSELSALLGPSFGDIFGQLTVDGSVSGENASFNGQLIVSGSHLSFRKAPLDELQAAIKLQGNEIQVTNAEFTHGDDFLRGQGVVNILGEKRYWGQVKASIADLSLYASFLQPPIAPEAFGGGLMLDWSGDGAQSAHSGAFTVRLNRIRPLVSSTAEAAAWQPIDVNAEATYSPESIFFSNLVLANGETAFSSKVVANPSSLTLQNLKLQHGKAVWLSGDAQIPLNVWAAWQNPATASWWNFQSPCKLDLKLDNLSLRDALLLTGRQQPFDGELTGAFKSGGTLAKLTADGHLAIKDADGALPYGNLKAGNATLDFKGSQLTVSAASGAWDGYDWNASGTVTAPDVRATSLNLAIKVPTAPFDLGQGISGQASLDLTASGQPNALTLSGSSQVQHLKVNRSASILDLLAPGGTGIDGPPPVLTIAGPAALKLDVDVSGTIPVTLDGASGTVAPGLQITGSIGQPLVTGKIGLSDFTINDGTDQLTIYLGTYYLNPPGSPSLFMLVSGNPASAEIQGVLYGTLANKHATWAAEPLWSDFELPSLFSSPDPSTAQP